MNNTKFSKSAPVFNIIDFGAVGDGTVLNTKAFQAAVDACVEAGGGTIIVPAGDFFTGPVHLKSNISLFLESGAKLVFSNRLEDYPEVETYWEGNPCKAYSPQIFAEGAENISILGRGVLEGQGEVWWNLVWSRKLDKPRPRMIGFQDCKNVLIEGITLQNSPSWTINPVFCENVTVNNVIIKNPSHSPNTDGINPDASKNVHISNCHIDVGDDCIAIKSGVETAHRKESCENITITNCTMVHGHGGVVIGSEMSGCVRNVAISNCIFQGTDRGIRIKTRRGRGGVVEDIRVNNIIMEKVFCPFVLNMYYLTDSTKKEQYIWDENPYPVTESTPAIRNIHFSNITAKEVAASACFVNGLPEMPVSNVTFDNIRISLARDAKPEKPAMAYMLEPMTRKGFLCKNVECLKIRHVELYGYEGSAYSIKNARDVEFFGCDLKSRDKDTPGLLQDKAEQVYIYGCKVD